jgi:hypothetical protein
MLEKMLVAADLVGRWLLVLLALAILARLL